MKFEFSDENNLEDDLEDEPESYSEDEFVRKLFIQAMMDLRNSDYVVIERIERGRVVEEEILTFSNIQFVRIKKRKL